MPWVFPGLKRRGPWVGGMVGKRPADRLRAAGELCGVADVTPHALRHTLATHLRGHYGLSGEQVRRILRHSQAATQEHYLHTDIEDLAEALRDVRF